MKDIKREDLEKIADAFADEHTDHYRTRLVTEQDKKILLDIKVLKKENALEKKIEFCNAIVEWFKKNAHAVKEFAAEEMLELKNDNWLEEGEEELTEEEFVKKMEINSVFIDTDNAVSLYYDDGDMFWGHAIVVQLDKSLDFKYASIEG